MGPTMSMSFELTLDIYADGSYKFTAATDGEDPSVETGFLGIENMISKAGILLPDGMERPRATSRWTQRAPSTANSAWARAPDRTSLSPRGGIKHPAA